MSAHIYPRDNSPYYYYDVAYDNERRRGSTRCKSKREAQKKADEVEAALIREVEAAKSVKLSDATARFFQVKKLRPNSVESYRYSFEAIYRHLGDFHLASLTDEMLRTYVSARQEEGATVRIRRDLAFLSSLYTTAKHWPGAGVTTNPVKAYDKSGLATAEERTTWLTKKQVEMVLNECRTAQHRLFVVLAIDTGMRRSELLNLQLNEIDLDEGLITLANVDDARTKTERGRRVIPLSQRALEELGNYLESHFPAHSTQFIFENKHTGKPLTDVKKFWSTIRKKLGLKDVRIHDFRHTFASHGLQAGVGDVTLMHMTGHADVRSLARYSHPSAESLRAARAQMDKHQR